MMTRSQALRRTEDDHAEWMPPRILEALPAMCPRRGPFTGGDLDAVGALGESCELIDGHLLATARPSLVHRAVVGRHREADPRRRQARQWVLRAACKMLRRPHCGASTLLRICRVLLSMRAGEARYQGRCPLCSRSLTGWRSSVSGNMRNALPRTTLALSSCLI